MTTPYKGQSVFWSTIASFLTGDWVDEKALQESINRLRDGSVWLRDEMTRFRQQLAKPSAGASAIIIGAKDLSTLVYDETAGDLNGKDLQIQSDTSGLKTVTFGMGKGAPQSTGAPLGPGDVVAQILNKTQGDPSALVDGASHLNIMSATASGLSTITAIGGSALGLLGFQVNQSGIGQTAGAAGAALIGVPPILGVGQLAFPGGTLESALRVLFGGAASAVIDKWEPIPWVAPPGTMPVDGSKPAYLLPTPLAAGKVAMKTKYLSQDMPRTGTIIRIKRPIAGAFPVTISNDSNLNINICGMAATTSTAVDLRWNGLKWTIAFPGQGVTGGGDSDD